MEMSASFCNRSGSSPHSGTAKPCIIAQSCMPLSSSHVGRASVSFSEVVKSHISARSPPSALFTVQEAPMISLLMGQEVEYEEECF
jgi:hypothetical protein